MIRNERPLVVDLDGTLVRTDLLWEGLNALLMSRPWMIPCLGLSLFNGKAAFKAKLADMAEFDVSGLPLNEEVVALIEEARQAGRRVYLASASTQRYVQSVADCFKFFDGVFFSDKQTNLSGRKKARLLVDAFGEKGFDYVGDAHVDLPVWSVAHTAYVVGGSGGLEAQARLLNENILPVELKKTGWLSYLRMMRPHQWVKNLLIFVPGMTGHVTSIESYIFALIAFFSFSLCASSVYVLNDLADFRHDRQHDSKRFRPLAAGTVPISHGQGLFPILLGLALILGWLISPAFIAVLFGYYLCSLAYSFGLKRILILDVIVLACLYGVRVIAGGAAFGVALSEWLVALSVFLFLSLAIVKRVAELANRRRAGRGDPSGRAYRLDDQPILENLAVGAAFAALLVLAFYIDSAAVVKLYAHPQALWGGGLVLAYWLCRILVLTHRGEMDDDPVAFAATDRISLICGALVCAIAVGAAYE